MSVDLNEAWERAVATLPAGWLGPAVSPYYPKGYEVCAWHRDEIPDSGTGGRRTRAYYGRTLVEALDSFAARPTDPIG